MVPQSIEILPADGEALRVTVEATLGSPANPLSEAAQMAKAEACGAATRHPASPSRMHRLGGLIDALAQATDVSALVEALRPG